MNFHGKDIKIFTGSSNVDVAQGIAGCLGLPLGKSDCTQFSDGEISVSLHESVRGSDCFIVQSTCAPVNDNLMEMLIMIDAMKRASAARITVVMPYFGYARQDRKAKARDPISAKLCADIITCAGADRVLTMDLHANQIQGFFNIPVDHLQGASLLANHMREKIGGKNDDYIVVSPDLGSVTRSRNFASKIGTGLAIIDKRRPKANVCEVMNIIGEISVSLHESVRGSDCFIVQSTCAPVNDNLMEMLIMIDAMKRASAARITVVMPYFGYARQDRKAKARDPISAKLCADIITCAGADRVLFKEILCHHHSVTCSESFSLKHAFNGKIEG